MRKDIWWVGRSQDDLRDFPVAARREAGHQLHLVQLGLEPDDWKPMPSVGPGTIELRIRDDTEHRVFYVAKHPEAIYVLHAFEKRAKKHRSATSKLGRERFKQLAEWRREEGL